MKAWLAGGGFPAMGYWAAGIETAGTGSEGYGSGRARDKKDD